jgi:hypothetical protein
MFDRRTVLSPPLSIDYGSGPSQGGLDRTGQAIETRTVNQRNDSVEAGDGATDLQPDGGLTGEREAGRLGDGVSLGGIASAAYGLRGKCVEKPSVGVLEGRDSRATGTFSASGGIEREGEGATKQ